MVTHAVCVGARSRTAEVANEPMLATTAFVAAELNAPSPMLEEISPVSTSDPSASFEYHSSSEAATGPASSMQPMLACVLATGTVGTGDDSSSVRNRE